MTKESNEYVGPLCERFWTEFKQYFKNTELAKKVLDKKTDRGHLVFLPKQYYARRFFDISKRGEILAKVLMGKAGTDDERAVYVEVLLEKQDRATNKTIYNHLEKHKKAIEIEIGFRLDWKELPDEDRSIITFRYDSNPRIESNWNEQYKWIIKTIEAFDRVFTERLQTK